MSMVWCMVFLGAMLHANHLADPAALVFPRAELLETCSKKREANVVHLVVPRDLDVIGVCNAAARYGNYLENPDALVVHNVVLDGPFRAAEPQLLLSEQSQNTSSIISEHGLNTLIRNLHVDGV